MDPEQEKAVLQVIRQAIWDELLLCPSHYHAEVESAAVLVVQRLLEAGYAIGEYR